MRAVGLLILLASRSLTASSLMEECNRAWVLIGQQRFEEAIVLLQRIVSQDDTFTRAYTLLGDAFIDSHRLDEGERYFHSLIQGGRSSALAFYGLGRMSTARSNPRKAADEFSECARRDPRALDCYEDLSLALANLSHRSFSADDLRIWIPLDSENPYIYWAIANMDGVKSERLEEEAAIRRGLDLARSKGEEELAVRFASRLAGIQAFKHQNFDEGLAHQEAALRFAERKDDWYLRVLFAEGVADYWALRDLDRAIALHNSILAFCRSIEHRHCEAIELMSLGRIFKLNGDLNNALAEYGRAKEMFGQFEDRPSVVNMLTKIGEVYTEQGSLQAAQQAYREGLQLAIKPDFERAYLLRGLADVFEAGGDYFQAIKYQTESVTMFKALGYRHTAGAGVGNVGTIYAALGDSRTALSFYQRSLESARKHSDLGEEQNNLNRLGTLYLEAGHPAAAMPFLKRAMDISDRVNYLPLRIASLSSLGEAHRQLKRFDEANAVLESALTLAHDSHNPAAEAKALLELGRCALDSRQLELADSRFRESLGAAQRSGAPQLLVAAQSGLAEVCIRRRRFESALESLHSAVDTLETLRSRVPTPDLRAEFFQQNSKIYEDITFVLSVLHRRHPARGYDHQSFELAERGRARSFLDLMAESRARISKGLTPEQIQRQNTLDHQLSEAFSILLKDKSEKNELAVKDAERRLANWSIELREANPRYQQLQYPEPCRAQDLMSLLGPKGVTLLEYQLGNRMSLLWVVNANELRMIVLPARAVIESQVNAIRRLLSKKPVSSIHFAALAAQVGRLYDILVKPIEPYLASADTLMIVPDGALYYLPFESLAPAGAASKPLVERYTIAYAPSASAYGDLLRYSSRPSRPTRELLAYANPALGTSAAQQPVALVRGVYERGGYEFGPLPNSENEVETIARLYPASLRKVLIGVAATESSVKEEKLTDYRRVHFATHAFLDEQTPARSGIVLSLANTGDEDGILRMNEILNLDLDADLVVLSACQTGLGKLVRGEGMVGLTRAFLYAGSARVVVSLWEVDDTATAEFMKIFYTQMNLGLEPSAALRRAKLEMMHSGPVAYRHPYFWAPFILVGLL